MPEQKRPPHRSRPTSSTAPHTFSASQRFQITHPFHPLFQQEFELVQYRRNWGEDRVYFHDAGVHLTSVPASWTSLSAIDMVRHAVRATASIEPRAGKPPEILVTTKFEKVLQGDTEFIQIEI